MRSLAENDHKAAFERIEDADFLHDKGSYPFAMYASGLAVECLLRAFRVLVEPTIDARHDLLQLWKKTALADVHREPGYDRIYELLIEISARWQNSYRFASNDEVRALLKKSRQDRGIKGNFVKYNSKKFYESAKEFVQLGGEKWKQLNKK